MYHHSGYHQASLRHELDKANHTIRQLQVALSKQATGVGEETVEQLAALEQKVEELLEERASLQDQVANSPKSSDTLMKKREAEIKALEREIANMEEDTRRQVQQAVADALREAEAGTGNKNDQIEDLQKELAEAIDDRDAARKQITMLERGNNAEAAREMKRLQKELDDSEAEVEKLEKAARSSNRDHQAELSRKDSQIRELQTAARESSGSQREMDQLTRDLKNAREQASRHQEQLERYKDQATAAKDEVSELKRQVTTLQSEKRMLESAARSASPPPSPKSPPKKESQQEKIKRERGKGDMDARVEAMMNESSQGRASPSKSPAANRGASSPRGRTGSKADVGGRSAVEQAELERQNRRVDELAAKREKANKPRRY